MKRCLLAIAVLILARVGLAAELDYDEKGCELGKWTADLSAAQKKAKSLNSLVLIDLAKNDGSCKFCNTAATGIYTKSAFQNWAKANNYPLVLGDYAASSGSAAKKTSNTIEKSWGSGSGMSELPQFFVIDGATGSRLGFVFMRAGTAWTGTSTKNVDMGEAGYFINAATPETVREIVDMLMNKIDDSPYNENPNPTTGTRQRKATATAIVPDAPEAAELTVHGVWPGKADLNGLCSTPYYYQTTRFMSYVSDQYDWFTFDCLEAGKAYEIKTPELIDEKKIGKLCLFKTLAAAQAATTYAAALEVANDPERGYGVYDMEDLRTGVTVTPDVIGPVYMLFTRRSALAEGKKKANEEVIVLKYNFTVQETAGGRYYFSKEENATLEGAVGLTITVSRDAETAGEEATAGFVLEEAKAAGYEEAKEGEDFIISSALREVHFAAGQTESSITINTMRGEPGVETHPRAFAIRLMSSNPPELRYLRTVVKIEDADQKSKPKGDILLNATTTATNTIWSMLGTNIVDKVAFTNEEALAGSLYYISVDPIFIKDIADWELLVTASRYDAAKEAYVPFYSKTMNDKVGYANIIYGCESATGIDEAAGGVSPEVVVTIARAGSMIGEFPSISYRLTWQRFDRPEVTFDGASGVTYASAELPTTVQPSLRADSVTAIIEASTRGGRHIDTEPQFMFDVGWRTVPPTASPAARAGEDFASATDTVAVVCYTNSVNRKPVTDVFEGPAVDVYALDKFSAPTRSFIVELLEGTNHFYTLGAERTYTVTLKADEAKPAASEEDPAVVTIGDSAKWAMTGARNLSYTNVEDWISVAFNDTNEFFRLALTNLNVRPAGAAVTVEVYCNGDQEEKELLKTFNAADLVVGLPQAPILSFAGFKEKKALIRLSRNVDNGVVCDYALAVREWRPSKGDGGALDEADPGDDTPEGAVTESLASAQPGDAVVKSFARTLNGYRDIPGGNGQPYAVNDTNDWFRFTGLTEGSDYNFSIGGEGSFSADADSLTNAQVSVFLGDASTMVTNLSLQAFREEDFDFRATDGRDVLIRFSRPSEPAAPAEIAYTFKARKYEWPVFTVSAGQTAWANSSAAVTCAVLRTENLFDLHTAILTVTDTNAVKVVADASPIVVTMPSSHSEFPISIPLVPAASGFWKRGGSFEVALVRDPSDPAVTISEPSNAVFTVTDASGLPENDYGEDDVAAGAQAYAFDKDLQYATNHCAKGQSLVWLNGTDTNDWYRFTGSVAGSKYRFTVYDLAAVNTNGLALGFEVYKATDGGVGELIASVPLADRATYKVEAADGKGFYVKVFRGDRTDADVSLRYRLGYREVQPSSVSFETTEAEVSEAAEAVYVSVVCSTDDGGPLDEDVTVKVIPDIDEDSESPAWPVLDYDPTEQFVTWAAGTTGGVKRVRIALTNYDMTWEGYETFKLKLEAVTDTEILPPAEMRVTIFDTDAKAYGTVGITSVDGEAASAKTTYKTREGDRVTLTLTRTGGKAGYADGQFTWKDGKTVIGTVTTNLFAGVSAKEAPTAKVELEVPTAAGFKASRALTLEFKLIAAAKTVTVTKGSPTTLKFSVTDLTYAGKVADYSTGDASKIAFRTSGTSWYLDINGNLASSVPAANGSVVMSASVKGPGTVKFNATFADAAGCTLESKAGKTTVRTEGLASGTAPVAVAVSAGAQTLTVTFKRPKTGVSGNPQVVLTDIEFVPDEAFRTIGTFSGPVAVQFGDEEFATPGLGTLTVGTTGKVSGKFTCANRVWTFSSKTGWAAAVWTCDVEAKSGTLRLPVALKVDPATGDVAVSGEGVSGTLAREVWGDKPMIDGAEKALAACGGYFTITLPEKEKLAEVGSFGSGYLTATVSGNGEVKAAGKLADGTAVSLSGKLKPVETDAGDVFVFAKPSAYKKGWYCQRLGFAAKDFGADGVKPVVTDDGSAGPDIPRWRSFAKGDKAFDRDLTVSGGWYDKTENLFYHYRIGMLDARYTDEAEEHVQLVINPAGSKISPAPYDGMFTTSFARSTGILTGYVREEEEVCYGAGWRTVRKSYGYTGVLTPYTDDGTCAGRGFFKWSDGKSHDLIFAGIEDDEED